MPPAVPRNICLQFIVVLRHLMRESVLTALVGETWRMYAVVANVRIEDVEAARAALADLRVGLVPRAPGFVSA